MLGERGSTHYTAGRSEVMKRSSACRCSCGAQCGCYAEKYRKLLTRQRAGSKARREAHRDSSGTTNSHYSPHAPGRFAYYPPVFVFAGGQPPPGFHQAQQEAADANKAALRRRLEAAEQCAREWEQRAKEAESRRVQQEQQMAMAFNEARTVLARAERFLNVLKASACDSLPVGYFRINTGVASSARRLQPWPGGDPDGPLPVDVSATLTQINMRVDLLDLVRKQQKTITIRSAERSGRVEPGRCFILHNSGGSVLCLAKGCETKCFMDITDDEILREGFLPNAGGDSTTKAVNRVLLRRVLSMFQGKWVQDTDSFNITTFEVVHVL